MFTLSYVLQLHDHLLFFHSVDLDIIIAQNVAMHSFVLILLFFGHAIYHMTINIPLYRKAVVMVSCCYEEVKNT